MPAVPSIYDTHCRGAGLLATTPVWGAFRRFRHRYFSDDPSDFAEPPACDLAGLNVIVSGANSGIGFEAAALFAARGASVVLACRAPPPHEPHPDAAMDAIVARHKHVKRENLEWWTLDCADRQSILAFGRRWRESGRTCDILCNNAGSAFGSLIHTKDGVELTRQVNFLSHCLLTFCILPSMRNAKAPRIVNTCSIFHFGGRLDFSNMDYERAPKTSRGLGGTLSYCDSKLWLLMWTRELQKRLSRSQHYRHVIAHGVHPGFVSTNIWNQPHIKELPWILQWLLVKVINLVSISPQQGSLCITHAALHPAYGFTPAQLTEYPARGESAKIGGLFFNRTKPGITRPEVDDPVATARLFERALQDVGGKEVAEDVPGAAPGLE